MKILTDNLMVASNLGLWWKKRGTVDHVFYLSLELSMKVLKIDV